ERSAGRRLALLDHGRHREGQKQRGQRPADSEPDPPGGRGKPGQPVPHRASRTTVAGSHPTVPSAARTLIQWPPSKTRVLKTQSRRSIASRYVTRSPSVTRPTAGAPDSASRWSALSATTSRRSPGTGRPNP